MNEVLKELGFTDKEIDIYLALISAGHTSASVLAYKTGIALNSVRYICMQLVKKGLVTYTKSDNVNTYTHEPLEKILYLYELKKKELKRSENHAYKVITEMKAKMANDINFPKTIYSEGVDDVIKAYITFFDSIPNNSVVCDYVSSFDDFRFPLDRERIIDACVKKRLEKNIHIKCLSTYSKPAIRLKVTDHCSNRETLFVERISDEVFETLLYKDIVMETVYTDDGVFSAITRHPQIVKMRMELFSLAWETAKIEDEKIWKEKKYETKKATSSSDPQSVSPKKQS